jgi:acyl-CoA synthetase (AMP-forming)/AMP-acid ligase II/acyl carrier protein
MKFPSGHNGRKEKVHRIMRSQKMPPVPHSTQFSDQMGNHEVPIEHDPERCITRGIRTVPNIGRPITNARVHVLDAGFRPVPIGVAGEIFIGGAGIGRGYLHRPELTAERFIADPVTCDPGSRLYKTGDLARWRSDGTIEHIGRNDRQVKIRGYRIESGEIEAQLLKNPQIRGAVVLAREDSPGNRRLVAYLTLATAAGERTLDAAQLRSDTSAALPAHMVPSAYVILDNMPLTSNRKLDKSALPPPEWDQQVSGRYEAPQDEIEEALADVWNKVLRIERVGRHDDFFGLGGHSLLVMELAVAISGEFAVRVPVADAFQYPTVSEMAARLTSLLDYEEFAL